VARLQHGVVRIDEMFIDFRMFTCNLEMLSGGTAATCSTCCRASPRHRVTKAAGAQLRWEHKQSQLEVAPEMRWVRLQSTVQYTLMKVTEFAKALGCEIAHSKRHQTCSMRHSKRCRRTWHCL